MHGRGTQNRADDATQPNRDTQTQRRFTRHAKGHGSGGRNQDNGGQRRSVRAVLIEADQEEERDKDDPATHTKTPSNKAGRCANGDQLPCAGSHDISHVVGG
jgi:hypothetical protein